MSWGLKLALWLLGLLTLIVVFVGVLLRPPRAVHFCGLALTRFADPVPPNSLALEDLQRFGAAFVSGNIRGQLQADSPEGTPESQTALVDLRVRVADFLARVEPGGPSRRWRFSRRGAVILYISAHGVVDERGEPCLLVHPDARQEGPEWLPVRELLQWVTAEPRLRDATKLVILEAGRLREDWRLGVLQNSFAEALVPVVQQMRETDRNLFVLNSTRLAEQSLWAPEIGGSLFGYAVATGLSGDADLAPRDNVVSLQELAAYLEARVDQLARRYRVCNQRPLLIPADAPANLLLAYADGEPATAPAAPAMDELRKRHAALGQLWQQRDALAAPPPQVEPLPSADPLGWADLQHALTRLERLVTAGQAYDFWSAHQRAGELLKRLSDRAAPIQLPVCSLALSARFDPPSEPEKQQADQLLQRALAPQEPSAAAAPTPPLRPTVASAAVWQWLGGTGVALDRAKLQQGLQFIRASQAADTTPVASELRPPEIQLLELLEQELDWRVAAAEVPLLIQAESRAAQVAADGDVRAHLPVAQPLALADQQLRLARDDLFVGGPDQLQRGHDLLIALVSADGQSGTYGDLAATKALLTEAFRLRDQVWSTQTDLAQWLMLHQPAADTLSRLQSLIDGAHELGHTLDALGADKSSAEVQDFKPRLQQLGELLRELQQRIGKLPSSPSAGSGAGPVYEDLLDLTELGPGHLVAVENLLSTELVTGEARERLRSLYLNELEQQSQGIDLRSAALDAASSAATGFSPKSEAQRHQDYLDAVFSVDSVRHPALELLSRSALPQVAAGAPAADPAGVSGRLSDPAARLAQLARFGGLMRRRLSDLVAVKDEWISAARQQLKQPDMAVSQARMSLSGADRLCRAAAGLAAYPLAGDDPCQLLRQLDLGCLLWWHAERTLDDFWGTQVGASAGGPSSYYFAALADQYMAAAQRLDPVPQAYESAVRARAAKYVSAAEQWGLPVVQDLYVGPDDRVATPRIFLPRQPDLPAGRGRFEISSDVGNPAPPPVDAAPPESRRDFDVVAASDSGERWSLPVTDALRGGASLQATCWYRGHRRQTSFALSPFRGTTVVFRRPDDERPTVLVSSAENQVGLVTFVLDCSISMKVLHALEGKLVDRLEISKSALRQVVQELDESYHRVGLIAYGHSAGWSKDEVETWRTPDARRRQVPPAEDVEQLLAIGRIARREDDPSLDLRRDMPQLRDLVPYGETPLYLALAEGIDQLTAYDRDQELVVTRDLVVLTDGANSIFGKRVNARPWTKGTWTPDKIRQKLDQQRAEGKPVRLHIVGFTANPDFDHQEYPAPDRQADEAMWRREREKWQAAAPERIAGEPILNASQPEQLVTALRSALERDKFYVQPQGAPPPAAAELRNLGERFPVQEFTAPGPYVVTVVGRAEPVTSEIRLEGGERIEMELDRVANPPRLRFRRYTKGQKSSAVQQDVRGCYIAPHGSLPAPGGRILRVSVQNQNEAQFSPRPRQIWAEVRPVPDGKPVFYLQDRQFEADCPVPMLQFQLQDFRWTGAELRLWFTFDDRGYVEPPPADAADSGHYRWQNVTLLVDRSRPQSIVVSERHDDPSSTSYPLRVTLQSPADVIRRSYSDDARRVQHVFEFAAGTSPPSEVRALVAPNPNASELDWIAPDPIVFEW